MGYTERAIHQYLNPCIDALVRQMSQDSDAYFPESSKNLVVYALGLTGEAGEVAEVFKKYYRGSIEREEFEELVAEELIDVFIYWINLVGLLGIDVEKVYNSKRNFNNSRFNANPT